MDPISFHPDETLKKAPEGSRMGDLPAVGVTWDDGTKGLISCWMPAPDEARALFELKPLYLAVISEFQPPILMTTDRSLVLGPDAPGFPDGAELPQVPPQKQLEMQVGSKGGKVHVQFNQSIGWIAIPPETAMAWAVALAEKAQLARGGTSGLAYPPGYKGKPH